MLFVTPQGEGLNVATAPRRAAPKLTAEEMQINRGKDAASWLRLGYLLRHVAEAWGRSYAGVRADYAAFRKASGLPPDHDPDASADLDLDGR